MSAAQRDQALVRAARGGNLEVMGHFLDKGATDRLQTGRAGNIMRETAMYQAACGPNRHIESVRLLLDRDACGTDVLTSAYGRSPGFTIAQEADKRPGQPEIAAALRAAVRPTALN